jgi:hypothetical protein
MSRGARKLDNTAAIDGGEWWNVRRECPYMAIDVAGAHRMRASIRRIVGWLVALADQLVEHFAYDGGAWSPRPSHVMN